MNDEHKKDKRKEPQQRPEDAEKQNAQQEREYRDQKEGKDDYIRKRESDKDAIQEYLKLEPDKIKRMKEEE